MPELPEVETTLRGIAPHIEQEKISRIVIRNRSLRWPVPQHLEKTLTGQTVQKLIRRGKYILFHCDEGRLLLHLGMSGSVRILTEERAAAKHDHIDICFGNGKILRFTDPRRFGALLYTEDDPYEHVLLSHLGPEPLSPEFNGAYLVDMAKRRSAPVKNFIMDGRIVVGVGNIYAAEALYLAGIHPLKPAGKISVEQYQKLAAAIKKILKNAIERGGTTLRDFTQSDGAPGYFSIKLKVYGKHGQPCPRCRGILELKRIGQRSTVFCPKCQPYK
jgi:formamidopyrimidine-DNA glycosylase